ncbi:DUF294 nucleotidyltransferase-like domain-containing protein [Methylonatrum kenyense]|uniref:DUF294 nucleotidyltransferase-like domain-containing protein n=1 Tax=Methylonatrum kenyense TaxID=455253 RepID=UPI0020BE3C58|nr:DUF294 nucleotidyltransferase-like domain-containing protein [Methylonatrum kenyense]MCK8517073.1 DUF294 nucleotidyltransferase-like domain-containing protein [Methylonatrum kenyense]
MTEGWADQCRDLEQQLDDAREIPALAAISNRFPGFQADMQAGSVDAIEQARQLTALMDRLTRVVIRLVIERRDQPAPGPWAWLACGSQGRSEQTVHTDQDNAMVYADDLPASADAWFGETARQISRGLADCGLPLCPGGVGPSNPEWRRPASGWRRAFEQVIRNPENRAVMLATHYMDLRVVDGPPDLFEPLRRQALTEAGINRRFMARLRDGAIRTRPPINLFGRFRTPWFGANAGLLDLKQGGILPLVQLARCFAVRGGLPALHTLDRLRQAQQAGLLSADSAQALADAYRQLTGIRARLQAESIQAGEPLANRFSPRRMTADELDALRKGFRAISAMQAVLRQTVLGQGL